MSEKRSGRQEYDDEDPRSTNPDDKMVPMARPTPELADARVEQALRELVDRFVGEVLAIVGGPRAPISPRPVAGRHRKRVRRTAATLRRLSDAVLGVLARTSDRSVSELAAAVGSTPRDVVRPLTLLLAEGRITRRGERKGTRYSLTRAASPPAKTRVVASGAARGRKATKGKRKRKR
jgi:hypothetical protein